VFKHLNSLMIVLIRALHILRYLPAGFMLWDRRMTGTRAPLKIVHTGRITSSGKADGVLPADTGAAKTETPRSIEGVPALSPLQPSDRVDLYNLHPCPQPRADRCTQSHRRALPDSGVFMPIRIKRLHKTMRTMQIVDTKMFMSASLTISSVFYRANIAVFGVLYRSR
jgi:hypothetical protein